MTEGLAARVESIRRLWRWLMRVVLGIGTWSFLVLCGLFYQEASWVPPRQSEAVEIAWARTIGESENRLTTRQLVPLIDALMIDARKRGAAGRDAVRDIEALRVGESETLGPMLRDIVGTHWGEASEDESIAVAWGRGVGLPPDENAIRRLSRTLGREEPPPDELASEEQRASAAQRLQWMDPPAPGYPDDTAVFLAAFGAAIVVWWNLRRVAAARRRLKVPSGADPSAWNHAPVWSSTTSDRTYQYGLLRYSAASIVRGFRTLLPILGAFLLFDVWVEAVILIGEGKWGFPLKLAVTAAACWCLARALRAFWKCVVRQVAEVHRSLSERIFPDDYSAGISRVFVGVLAVAPSVATLCTPIFIGLILMIAIQPYRYRPSPAEVWVYGTLRVLLAGYVVTVTILSTTILSRGVRAMIQRWRFKKYARIQSVDPTFELAPPPSMAETQARTPLRLSVAHLSDLHIVEPAADGSVPTTAEGHPAGNIGLKKILRDFGQVLRAADVVAITGDLTDSGAIGEYAAFREMAFAAAGDDIQRKWVVLPGNHDVSLPDPKAFTRFEREGFPARRRRLIRAMAFLDEIQGDRAIVAPFADGRHWTLRQFLAANRLLLTSAIEQPSSRDAEDIDELWSSLFPMAIPVSPCGSDGTPATNGILLFVFDSNDRASSVITNAFGRVSADSIHRAYALRDDLRKSMAGFAPVYLLHHHVEIPMSVLAAMDNLLETTKVRFMKLVNSFAFVSFCAAGPRSVILHGHRHIAYYGRLHDRAGVPTLDVASARSSTQGNEHIPGDVASGFDLIHLEVGGTSPVDVRIGSVEPMRCGPDPLPTRVAKPPRVAPGQMLAFFGVVSGVLWVLAVGGLTGVRVTRGAEPSGSRTVQITNGAMVVSLPGLGILALTITLSLFSVGTSLLKVWRARKQKDSVPPQGQAGPPA